jgi:xanthine dehydrogenase accessory factor
MARRLFIVGRGATAERLAELGGHLGYDELRLTAELPDGVTSEDHVVIAEEETSLARQHLVAAASGVLPAYLGYAAPHREGWKALVRLAASELGKDRIDAVCAPAGVDVGAETPEEVAIAVAAELVALRRGRNLPSAGLAITPRRPKPLVEPRPRRLIGAFAGPAPDEPSERDDDDDDEGEGRGKN